MQIQIRTGLVDASVLVGVDFEFVYVDYVTSYVAENSGYRKVSYVLV